eukprot:m.185132 g.185132  ORF g.185132 m.185132 type:complete len:77 (+) comp15565_c0_seq21:1209-1439(+)
MLLCLSKYKNANLLWGTSERNFVIFPDLMDISGGQLFGSQNWIDKSIQISLQEGHIAVKIRGNTPTMQIPRICTFS